jgi:7-keto-8-aminopelargonate synthetase-like enzyme
LKNAASFGYAQGPGKTVIILLPFANLHSCRYLYIASNDFLYEGYIQAASSYICCTCGSQDLI